MDKDLVISALESAGKSLDSSAKLIAMSGLLAIILISIASFIFVPKMYLGYPLTVCVITAMLFFVTHLSFVFFSSVIDHVVSDLKKRIT